MKFRMLSVLVLLPLLPGCFDKAANDIKSELDKTRQQLDTVSKRLDDSIHTGALAINTFSTYLDDYYSTNPERRDKARTIIHQVFGDIPNSQKDRINVSFTVAATGLKENTKLDADIVFADVKPLNVNDIQSALAKHYSFIPVSLASTGDLSPTNISVIEQAVRKNVDRYQNQTNSEEMLKTCGPESSRSVQCIIKVNRTVPVDRLTKAIMATITTTSNYIPRTHISRDYLGGRFAIVLFPTNELLLHDDLRLEAIHHYKGNMNERLPGFEEQGYTIDIAKLKSSEPFKLVGDSRDFSWAIVPLKVGERIFTMQQQEM